MHKIPILGVRGEETRIGDLVRHRQAEQRKFWVYSEPGLGRTFKVFLHACRLRLSLRRSYPPENLPSGTETILLVEDGPMVRDIAARVLRSHGYRVLEASTGAEALNVQSDWNCESRFQSLRNEVMSNLLDHARTLDAPP